MEDIKKWEDSIDGGGSKRKFTNSSSQQNDDDDDDDEDEYESARIFTCLKPVDTLDFDDHANMSNVRIDVCLLSILHLCDFYNDDDDDDDTDNDSNNDSIVAELNEDEIKIIKIAAIRGYDKLTGMFRESKSQKGGRSKKSRNKNKNNKSSSVSKLPSSIKSQLSKLWLTLHDFHKYVCNLPQWLIFDEEGYAPDDDDCNGSDNGNGNGNGKDNDNEKGSSLVDEESNRANRASYSYVSCLTNFLKLWSPTKSSDPEKSITFLILAVGDFDDKHTNLHGDTIWRMRKVVDEIFYCHRASSASSASSLPWFASSGSETKKEKPSATGSKNDNDDEEEVARKPAEEIYKLPYPTLYRGIRSIPLYNLDGVNLEASNVVKNICHNILNIAGKKIMTNYQICDCTLQTCINFMSALSTERKNCSLLSDSKVYTSFIGLSCILLQTYSAINTPFNPPPSVLSQYHKISLISLEIKHGTHGTFLDEDARHCKELCGVLQGYADWVKNNYGDKRQQWKITDFKNDVK